MAKWTISILVLLISFAAIGEEEFQSPWGLTKEERSKYTAGLGVGWFTFLTLYGTQAWQWGETGSRIRFESEGWFQKDSYAGGADKLGHLYSFYIQKRSMNWFLYNMGWNQKEANLYSTLMASAVGLGVEIGDAISSFKFSWEDLVSDFVGTGIGHLMESAPWIDQRFGIQLEFFPSDALLYTPENEKIDVFSDYSGMKFLFQLKGAGFHSLEPLKIAKFINLNFGYYTRGYRPILPHRDKYRAYSVGVGANLSEIFFNWKRPTKTSVAMGRLLKYWTPPGTTVPLHTKRLN